MSRILANPIRMIALVLAAATTARAEVSFAQSGGKLVLKGDAEADVIAVDGTGALGELKVTVGATAQTFVGVRDIEIKTGDGNDTLNVGALQIGGSLKVKLGGGDDAFNLDDASTIALATFIGKDVEVAMGGQAKDEVQWLIAADRGIMICGNVSIKGAADIDMDGAGTTSLSGVPELFFGGNLLIDSFHLGAANPNGNVLHLDDVNIGGSTLIKLGDNADDVGLTNIHVARKFEIKLGDGNDFVDFGSSDSEFNSEVLFDGGSGVDTVKSAAFVTFAVAAKTKNVEILP